MYKVAFLRFNLPASCFEYYYFTESLQQLVKPNNNHLQLKKQNKTKIFLEDTKWLTQLAVVGIGHAPRTSLYQSHTLFSALPQAEGLGSKDLWMRAGKGILAQIA